MRRILCGLAVAVGIAILFLPSVFLNCTVGGYDWCWPFGLLIF